MPITRQNGQLNETQYFDNVGGLNLSDSVFKVKDTQSTGGANFEYTQTGGIQKRRGAELINSSPNAELRTRGLDIFNTTLGAKTVIRAAGTRIQAVDLDTPTFTNLSQDTTAAGTSVFPSTTSVTTAFAPFNTDTVSLLNFSGGTDSLYAVYSSTKYTKNGAVAPTGSMSATTTVSGATTWNTTGTFWYAISWHKASTGAESNATLDLSVAVTNTLATNVITLSSVASVDATTYDYGILWRSAVNGATGFTAGDYVKTFATHATTVSDTGSALLQTQDVPRVNSTILDNSTLPTGTYNTVALWKRRLVTSVGSQLCISDINAPEAWPTVNYITVLSGGPITALAVIAFNTDFGNDEYLAIFKERELWLLRGSDYTDFTLSFIDTVGCPAQSLVVLANGFLSWVDYRGFYLWDGSGKPIYTSQPLEPFFQIDGDINKPLLQYGYASYFRNRNMIYWFLPSKTYGDQALALKMDLRLTLPGVESSLSGRVIPGVFVDDTLADTPIFAAHTYLPSGTRDEVMLAGDASGYLYYAYQAFSDNSNGIEFEYYTPFIDMDLPNVDKRFTKVVLWVDGLGDWDMTLDYWSGFRAALSQKSTLQAPITTQAQNSSALWDVAYWDQAYWDSYTQNIVPVVFNLNNSQGNAEGDCIRLRIRQDGVDQPVTIYGYSVFWQQKGLHK
jgi:hypothetical protein